MVIDSLALLLFIGTDLPLGTRAVAPIGDKVLWRWPDGPEAWQAGSKAWLTGPEDWLAGPEACPAGLRGTDAQTLGCANIANFFLF